MQMQFPIKKLRKLCRYKICIYCEPAFICKSRLTKQIIKKRTGKMEADNKRVELYGLKHIAFIMDGNGRWAETHGKPREYGHKIGARVFREIVKYCRLIGIEYVTVYAFSTENWKRPRREIESIMKLLNTYLDDCNKEMDKNDISVRFIGDISVLDEKLKRKIEKIENNTENKKLTLNIALNYGGRDELVAVYNNLLKLGVEKITEKDIESALYTAGCPDPDMIVRTAGEYRLSNFLLWQASYSEFYFTDVLWPDMTSADVDAAIAEYGRRRRKFGGI